MEILWFGIVLISLLAYLLLDGYDLGAGTIAVVERDRHTRHQIIEQVANVWDGNETWLVMAGVSLWAGFPLAFGVLLPHLYIPLVVMLLALILRGFSIEMISQRDGAVGERWYRAFGIGSLVAAFAQGFALGALTRPVAYDGASYVGGSATDVFSWYSVLMGVGVVVLDVTLGYAYLYLQGVGDAQTLARRGRLGVVSTGVLAVLALALVGATPAGMNLSTPARAIAFAGTMVFAVVALVIASLTFRSSAAAGRRSGTPMAAMVTATVAVVVAFLIGHAPDLAPGLTLDDAAATSSTYTFLLVGIGLNLPLIAYYTWFSQRALSRRSPVLAPEGEMPR
ncbi:MAG TPA: cytochrome d ubiquinol oxidase subunit II [Cellulomonas sp.]